MTVDKVVHYNPHASTHVTVDPRTMQYTYVRESSVTCDHEGMEVPKVVFINLYIGKDIYTNSSKVPTYVWLVFLN